MFFNNENKIWAEARLPGPVLLFNSLPPNLDAIFMTQWTKVLFEGPKRTVDPTPLDVFDIAMDAEIQKKIMQQKYLKVRFVTNTLR